MTTAAEDARRMRLRNRVRAHIQSEQGHHHKDPSDPLYIFGVHIEIPGGRLSVREDFVDWYTWQGGESDMAIDQLIVETSRAGWKW